MSKVINKYTVVRVYENKYGIDEMVKRIIRIHLNTVTLEQKNNKECSNREVK